MEELKEATVVLTLRVPVRVTPDMLKKALLAGMQPGNLELVYLNVSMPGVHLEEMGP